MKNLKYNKKISEILHLSLNPKLENEGSKVECQIRPDC